MIAMLNGGAARTEDQDVYQACGVRGCDAACSRRKPYCTQHTENNPHANAVKDMILQRGREITRARNGDAALDGFLWREIRGRLRFAGTGSAKTIALACELPQEAVSAVLRLAAAGGLVDSNAYLVWLTEKTVI